jgi:RNA polymerase sigma-70 factor (ECF subfamily)
MTEREEDRRRVRALLAGDANAFDVFFEEYFPRLYRFVLPRVDHAVADAQDICQETLLRALRRLSSYRGEAALFSWICQIAANQVSDYWQ